MPGVAMSRVVKLTLVALLVWCLHVSGFAQLSVPPTPLNLSDHLPIVQTPAYANFADPRCDSDGTIYMRQEASDNRSWDLAKISPDGSAQQTELAAVPRFGDTHTFVMATSEGGSVHELVRAWDNADRSDSPSIYYLRFDGDGSFRSRQRLENEFIPSMLLPLPSGNFLAAGVVVKKPQGVNDVEEVPLAGIFDADARLITRLQKASANRASAATQSSSSDGDIDDAIQQGGHVTLGDDGNIYLLLSGSNTRVRVYRQTGEFRGEMTLQQPFQEGLATGVWVSGGRMLVTYEGEADDPKDAITYILYDAGTGQLLRAYRPQFSGTVACFQDGQTLTVLVNQKYSGQLAIGRVDLQ
jgi:hypothetical protein